jgi:hypothetical protein
MTIVASNGQSFGPYQLNLNENSGAIARTALNPSLVLEERSLRTRRRRACFMPTGTGMAKPQP